MGWRIVATISLMSMATAASAENWTESARTIGMLLGSERPCGLSYDRGAVSSFVGANAEAGRTLDFIDAMNMSASETESSLMAMDQTQRATHCEEATRIAKAHGLI